ncbi:MFS transporter, partial [Rhodococcus rhodnii]
WLLEHFHWGSVFLINLPVMAVLLVALPLLVRESRDPSPGPLDFASVALSLLAMLPAVYGIKKLASDGIAPLPLALLFFGLTAGLVFVRRQLRLEHPLIDIGLFRNRRFSVAIATNFMLVFSMVSSLFFLTQYLQLVLGISPMRAGFVLVPGLLLSIVAGFVAIRLVRGMGLTTVLLVGIGLIAVGYGVLVFTPVSGGAALVAFSFAALGTGVGLAETLTNSVVLSTAPAERAGGASAISETAYELGGALGVALLGSVLTAAYSRGLADVPGVTGEAMSASRETLGAAATAAEATEGDAGVALMDAAREAFTSSMHVTSAIAVVIVLGAGVMVASVLRGRAHE